MIITIYDPYVGKFTSDMQKWWEAQGHEVRRSTYYDPKLVEGSDVLWFETTDNNILSATNPSQALLADAANFKPWDLHEHDLQGKKVIVRPIDIEVWQQHYWGARWDVVTDMIFIAPHIRNLVEVELLDGYHQDMRVHTIPCGVNLDRYSFKERRPGFDIAVVSERWISKGTDYILQIALKLQKIDPRYKIHWLGKWSETQWEQAYMTDFVERHKLNIEFTNVLSDDTTVDEFLEDKNYLLHGSHKEAFSYAMGEAAAKGIKVVGHRFYGADWLWGDSGFLWDSIDQAVDMITDQDNYDSPLYRRYLIDKGYTTDSMMSKIQEVING